MESDGNSWDPAAVALDTERSEAAMAMGRLLVDMYAGCKPMTAKSLCEIFRGLQSGLGFPIHLLNRSQCAQIKEALETTSSTWTASSLVYRRAHTIGLMCRCGTAKLVGECQGRFHWYLFMKVCSVRPTLTRHCTRRV